MVETMVVSPIVRKRLEAQGFGNLNDAEVDELAPWLRWSPLICTLFMVAGIGLESPAVLWSLAATGFLGAVLPFHPFDLLYNYAARYLTGTGPLPHHGPQRRFACAMATVWLIGTGWAFHAGAPAVGYLLGVPLILVAALVSSTHICIPSIIYNRLFTSRRTAHAQSDI